MATLYIWGGRIEMRTKNVFQVGKIATGESFIGRKAVVEEVSKRALSTGTYRALSMVGLTRVGKSSIVANAIKENEVKEMGIIYVNLIMSEYNDFFEFWKAAAQQIQESVIFDFRIRDERMEDAFAKVASCLAEDENDILINTSVKLILKRLCDHEIPLLIVVDEFDAARVVLKKKSYFEMLRTIASSADFMVNMILISRRSLYVIEECTPENSTFHGVFQSMTIDVFSQQDIAEYYKLLTKYDIFLTDEDKDYLIYFCGYLPYLLSIVGYDMTENKIVGKSISVQDIVQKEYTNIIRYYDDVEKQIAYDHLMENLLAVLEKAPADCYADDVSPLLDMGIIYVNGGRYIAVCQHFTDYLLKKNLKDFSIPEYTIEKFERSRQIMKEEINIYGNVWGGVGGKENKIVVTDNFVNHSEEFIRELEHLKENAEKEEKTELDCAIEAIRKNDSNRLSASLKKISGFIVNTASNVTANVIITYMKFNGIIP